MSWNPPGGYNPYQGYPPQQQATPNYGQQPQSGYMQGYPQQGYSNMSNQYPPQMSQQQYPQEQYYQQTAPVQTDVIATRGYSQTAHLQPISGNRRAVLIGINYINNPTCRLQGAINDAKNMRDFLMQRYGFQDTQILLLTDDSYDPNRQPTKQVILAAFQWLLNGVRAGDSLFFHYSGHGSQVHDQNGDEEDMLDETILPLDFKSAGQILDDDLHRYLVKPLPYGCRLTALMDCCHSGTGMDLPYIFEASARSINEANLWMVDKDLMNKKFKKDKKAKKDKKGKKEKYGYGDEKKKKKKEKKTKKKKKEDEIRTDFGVPVWNEGDTQLTPTHPQASVGDVILFGGCRDDQTAADSTSVSSYGSRSGGAMTDAFIKAVSMNPHQTYAQVIYTIRDILNSGARAFSQIPQLSAGRPIDMNEAFTL